MTQVSTEKKTLIEAAKAAGFKITAKQIDRWRLEELLPKPMPTSRGRGGGVARVPPAETIPQLLALCALLKEMRSFDRAAFRLWIDNFNVPLSRVRKALKGMGVPSPSMLAAMSKEERARVLAESEMKAADDRDAPKGMRRYARRGKFAPFMEKVADAVVHDPMTWSESDRHAFAKSFEEMSGLDRGRVGDPKLGVQPWIHTDTADAMAEALVFSRDFDTATDNSSPEQLERARRVFRCIEPLQRLVKYTTATLGHCFGLETIALGFATKHPDALLFQALLIYSNKRPELVDIVRTMEVDAQKVLTQLEDGLKTQNTTTTATP